MRKGLGRAKMELRATGQGNRQGWILSHTVGWWAKARVTEPKAISQQVVASLPTCQGRWLQWEGFRWSLSELEPGLGDVQKAVRRRANP